MNQYVIETKDLSKKFKNVDAVEQLSLNVPRGSIFAYLGPNGAGKTTTIKMLMNLIAPTSGSASVLGVKAKQLGSNEWRRIGYVSENQDLPKWMTTEQFLAYCEPMYPNWDKAFCRKMIADFNLPLKQKIKTLSRGMAMKVALLSSMAYRPELLVLDEPFTGLDPLVRDEFIQGLLDISKQEEWSIFVSSHDIHEVERLADWVGIIDKGILQLVEPIETLQGRFCKIDIILDSPKPLEPPAESDGWPKEWVQPGQNGRVFSFFYADYKEGESETLFKTYFPGCKFIDTQGLSLREIFIAMARNNRDSNSK